MIVVLALICLAVVCLVALARYLRCRMRQRKEGFNEQTSINADTFSKLGKVSLKLMANIKDNILGFTDEALEKGAEILKICTRNKRDLSTVMTQIQTLKPKLEQISTWSSSQSENSTVSQLKNALEMISSLNNGSMTILNTMSGTMKENIQVKNRKALQLSNDAFSEEKTKEYKKNRSSAEESIKQFTKLREAL